MLVRLTMATAVLLSGLFFSTRVSAEVKVTISKTHLCCGACVRAVDKTLGEIDGVEHKASQTDGSIAISAKDVATAQKAIDALAKAGFHGSLDNKDVKYKAVEAPEGKVKRLEITGIHNCCGACTKSIKGALKEVNGVAADTAKPKEDSFVVEGDFSAGEVVEALLKAGFHISIKK